MNTKYKAFSSDVTVIEGERAVSAVISTTAVDRDNEVLVPQGCNWKDFQNNPVIFLNHNYADFWGSDSTAEKLPIGKCTALTRDKDDISFKMTFAERPANYPAGKEWIPDTLLSLYQQGVMRAFSVGFIPVETRAATDKDLLDYGADCRRVVSKWKLLEVSCVPLPANQEAVALAVSKKLITQDQADEMIAKSGEVEIVASAESDEEKSATQTCAECGKKFPPDEMDGDVCETCAEAKKAAAVETPEPQAVESPAPKRMTFFIGAPPDPEPDVSGIVERGVNMAVAKRRGAVYFFA